MLLIPQPQCKLVTVTLEELDSEYYLDVQIYSFGRRPAFVLPGTLYVDDSGNVVTNEPPTAPGSINVTNTVAGGQATITLTAATDPDGTIASYRYERQVDGGQWQQFADVNSLTQTDQIGEDGFGSERAAL